MVHNSTKNSLKTLPARHELAMNTCTQTQATGTELDLVVDTVEALDIPSCAHVHGTAEPADRRRAVRKPPRLR